MHNSARGRFGSEVTIDDVATAAGVSIRTVSRVLNNSTRVNADTRARIEAAVARLGFKPSLRARGLATGRSYLLGLVHSELNALVLDEVQRGAVQEAARRGYELVVHPSFTDGEDPIGDVIDFARRSRVDGLLVMAPVSGIAGLPEALSNAGVAACALSAINIAGYDATLVYGEREGAAEAARHLIALGHRRIGMITGPDLISSRERCKGFLAVLAENGLQLVGEARGDYGFESGVEGAAALFALDPRPTAIFAANDIMAAGVIKAAANHAIPVPSALSVVGFDNNLLAHVLTPALTTVDRPMRGIAEAATAHLIDIVEGTHDAPEFVPQLRLIIGESTAPPPS